VLRELEPSDDTTALIADRLRAIYAEEYPDDLPRLEAALPRAAAALAVILERNVWPQMNITWNTYPSHLAHFDDRGDFSTSGCFRCHDGRHESEAGEPITMDCEACHAILAMEERNWRGLQGMTAEVFLRR
jgi:formate-dependent nitrite reductase cytochrome c552 subunit